MPHELSNLLYNITSVRRKLFLFLTADTRSRYLMIIVSSFTVTMYLHTDRQKLAQLAYNFLLTDLKCNTVAVYPISPHQS